MQLTYSENHLKQIFYFVLNNLGRNAEFFTKLVEENLLSLKWFKSNYGQRKTPPK